MCHLQNRIMNNCKSYHYKWVLSSTKTLVLKHTVTWSKDPYACVNSNIACRQYRGENMLTACSFFLMPWSECVVQLRHIVSQTKWNVAFVYSHSKKQPLQCAASINTKFLQIYSFSASWQTKWLHWEAVLFRGGAFSSPLYSGGRNIIQHYLYAQLNLFSSQKPAFQEETMVCGSRSSVVIEY